MAYRDGDSAVINRAAGCDWRVGTSPSLVPRDRFDHVPRPPQPVGLSASPEIDCLRGMLPPQLLDAAALRAAETGVTADCVLITWGLLSEETYVAALAAFLGMAFEPLFSKQRDQCPLLPDDLIQAANTGMLPLRNREGDCIVVAPRLVFRTNWMAREAITLTYAKWFYGANTHPEAGSIIASDGRLDDQLIALNVNLWW